jgi:hypothetical protein
MATHVDYDTDKRIIYVTTAPTDGVLTLDVQVDIYSDIKEDWKTNSTLNKLDFPLRPTGGDTIVGTKIKSPFYFIKNPWRFRPYEANHTLYLGNAYLVVDGGGEPWLTTLGAYTVNIRDSVPADAFTLASDTQDVADAVWDEALSEHTLSGSAGNALGNVSAGADPATIADAVWDEAIGDHVAADTFGAKNQNLVPSEDIEDYKATDVSISVSGIADAVWDEALVDHTAVGSFGSKNQNLVPSENIDDYKATEVNVSMSGIADAVWDETRADHVAVGSFGEKNQLGVPSENVDDYKATEVSVSASGIADAVWDEAIGDHTTADTFGAKNQNLVPSENIEDYKGGTVDINYSGITSAVWDALLSGYQIPGSAGEALGNVSAGADPLQIADAVWDEVTADHNEQGTYGHELATKADLAASASTDLTPAYSGTAIQGSTVTGDYTSTFTRDNTYWELAEDASNGITLEFTFYIPKANKPGVFNLFGRYTGQPAINHHQELWIYNYESVSWELLNNEFILGGNAFDTLYTHE